jgi:hypothetical protein
MIHDLAISFRRSFHEGVQFPMAVRLFGVRLEKLPQGSGEERLIKGVQAQIDKSLN